MNTRRRPGPLALSNRVTLEYGVGNHRLPQYNLRIQHEILPEDGRGAGEALRTAANNVYPCRRRPAGDGP